jgi:hypothetical protein
MTEILKSAIATIGIDVGKNSFYVVGLDGRGAIVCCSFTRTASFRKAG